MMTDLVIPLRVPEKLLISQIVSRSTFSPQTPENISNIITPKSDTENIPPGFPHPPDKVSDKFDGNDSQQYKEWMKKRVRYDDWLNCLIAYRLREKEGNKVACQKILQRLKQSMEDSQSDYAEPLASNRGGSRVPVVSETTSMMYDESPSNMSLPSLSEYEIPPPPSPMGNKQQQSYHSNSNSNIPPPPAPPPPAGSYHQPQQYESNYQQPQQYESSYEQPQQYESNYHQPQQYESNYQQPQQYESNYQEDEEYGYEYSAPPTPNNPPAPVYGIPPPPASLSSQYEQREDDWE